MLTLRLKYTKESYMSLLSHLELMKLFERIFRFNKLPLKYSEGFNPIPRITFAAPLSVGYSSVAEIMEVQLNETVSIDDMKALQFPAGIDIIDAAFVESKLSLMAGLTHAEYMINLTFDHQIEENALKGWVQHVLDSDTLNYEKKTKKGTMKTLNAREQIRKLQLVNVSDNDAIIKVCLQSGSNGSLNPETFVSILLANTQGEKHLLDTSVMRSGLYYEKGDDLLDLFLLKNEVF